MKHGSHTRRTSCLGRLMFVWEKNVLSQNPTWKSKNNPFEQGIRPSSELACLDIAIRQRWTAWKLKLKNWCSAQRCSHVGCGCAFMAKSFGGRMTRKFGICCFNNFFTTLFHNGEGYILYTNLPGSWLIGNDFFKLEMFLDHFRNLSISRWFGENRRHLGARGYWTSNSLSPTKSVTPFFPEGYGIVATSRSHWLIPFFWDLVQLMIQVKSWWDGSALFFRNCVCVVQDVKSHQQYDEDVWKLGMALQYNYSRGRGSISRPKICRFHPQERGPDRGRGYSQGVGSSPDGSSAPLSII